MRAIRSNRMSSRLKRVVSFQRSPLRKRRVTVIARKLPEPLRRFYELGQRASARPKAEIKNLAGTPEEPGPSIDYVRKARLFEQRMVRQDADRRRAAWRTAHAAEVRRTKTIEAAVG